MNKPVVPVKLVPLVEYLNKLTSRPMLEELISKIEQSQVSLEDVQEFVRFEPKRYRRNLVAEGTWYSVLVLCWRSGQRSPIHDHASSVCAFKVLTGVCSETAYRFSEIGQVYPLHTEHLPAGKIVATQDSDTHQVSNLQPMPEDLVTLHVYSPALKTMGHYSIMGTIYQDENQPSAPEEEYTI
jgi:cysteine dioxygenase